MKKIIVQFNFPKCTQQQYDQVWNDLRAKGYENPSGLIFHVGGATKNGGWSVTDIWDSKAQFENFSKILMPIMEKNKIPAAEPNIMIAHYIYQHVYQNIREESYA